MGRGRQEERGFLVHLQDVMTEDAKLEAGDGKRRSIKKTKRKTFFCTLQVDLFGERFWLPFPNSDARPQASLDLVLAILALNEGCGLVWVTRRTVHGHVFIRRWTLRCTGTLEHCVKTSKISLSVSMLQLSTGLDLSFLLPEYIGGA